MRVDLVELMRTREVHHPSRILLLESQGRSDLRIEIAGYPWWLESPELAFDQRITLQIEGITGGVLETDLLQADSFDEDLESFEVRPLSEYEWAAGVHSDIYCNSPLSNPLEIYAMVHDYLLSVDSPHPPGHYLNLGNSGCLSEFAEIASSPSFLLCRGPQALCQAVCRVLRERGAKFNIIRGKDLSKGLVCVRLKGSHLICRAAHATFNTG